MIYIFYLHCIKQDSFPSIVNYYLFIFNLFVLAPRYNPGIEFHHSKYSAESGERRVLTRFPLPTMLYAGYSVKLPIYVRFDRDNPERYTSEIRVSSQNTPYISLFFIILTHSFIHFCIYIELSGNL